MITLLVPLAILLNAFVLTKLWAWFIVPFGIMEIGLAHAWGIALIVHFLTHQYNVAKEHDGDDELVTSTVTMFVAPLFAWAFGALAHYFM